MPGRKSNTEFRESKFAPDMVKIMQAGEGPYTRSMLAKGLENLYPDMYWQDIMNEVSSAILMDRLSKANRFQPVKSKKGYYELR